VGGSAKTNTNKTKNMTSGGAVREVGSNSAFLETLNSAPGEFGAERKSGKGR